MITLATNPPLTDQLQGWGTAAGALITAALLVYEVVTGRRARQEAVRERAEAAEDRARLDAERRDAEMAQARTIVVTDLSASQAVGPERVPVLNVSVEVCNFGTNPVLDVDVHVYLGSGAHRVEGRVGGALSIAPGHTTFKANQDFDVSNSWQLLGLDPTQVNKVAVPQIFFTDMAGLRWRRVGSGQPERVTD